MNRRTYFSLGSDHFLTGRAEQFEHLVQQVSYQRDWSVKCGL